MAFSDPQTVTINAVDKVMPKTSANVPGSTQFLLADGTVELVPSHSYGKRTRHVARLNVNKVAADPITAVNVQLGCSVSLVIDTPRTGFTPTELKDNAAGLLAWLTASSNAHLIQVIGGE